MTTLAPERALRVAPEALDRRDARRLMIRYWVDWSRWVTMTLYRAARRRRFFRRSETGLRTSYEQAWSPDNATWMRSRGKDRTFLRHGASVVYASYWYMDYHQLSYIERWLREAEARSCLELGCGRGPNLAFLAIRNPSVRFYGCDLSHSGLRGAREWGETLPDAWIEFSEGDLALRAAYQRQVAAIRVAQATSRELPFPDKAFDVTFTRLALEQMNYCADEALGELRRVTRRWCVMVEPFPEANGLRGAFHLWLGDYFRRRIRDIEAMGFRCLHFEPGIPSYLRFGMAAGVFEVR